MPRGALKSSLLLAGTLGLAKSPKDLAPMPTSMSLRSSKDLEGIVLVVQRWAKAWHEGDTATMSACLHPDLTRHILGVEPPSGREGLQRLAGIQSVLGRAVSEATPPRAQVWVLDVQGHSGSARVDLGPWTAFMHLAAHKEAWAIANVLWEWRK